MTPNRVPGPRGQASGLRQARIARVHMIRRRVIAGSVALFVTVWMLITLMLVTGHDPALARQRTASVRSASTSTTTPSTTTTAGHSSAAGATKRTAKTTTSSTTTAASPSTSSSTASSASGSGVSAVTSSQS